MRRFLKRAGRTFAIVRFIGLALLVAVVIAVSARYGTNWPLIEEEFFANVISEILGLIFTVLVIDALNEMRVHQHERRALISQMSSPDAAFAGEAVRILRVEGWLTDGSLRGALLHGANLAGVKLFSARMPKVSLRDAHLQDANLDRADLSGSFLSTANLQNASLREANLRGTTFTDANLRGANLTRANLQGAYLTGADLRGAIVTEAQLQTCASLRDAILPEEIRLQSTTG